MSLLSSLVIMLFVLEVLSFNWDRAMNEGSLLAAVILNAFSKISALFLSTIYISYR
ncbi:hypothetical protein D9M70_552420 [compost metagenome]